MDKYILAFFRENVNRYCSGMSGMFQSAPEIQQRKKSPVIIRITGDLYVVKI